MNYFKSISTQKNLLALVLLWCFGVVMILLLIVPAFQNTTGSLLSKNNRSTQSLPAETIAAPNKNTAPKSAASSNAFVFVNINKKHFLTKFASFVSNEEIAGMENNLNNAKKPEQTVFAVKKISVSGKPKQVDQHIEDFSVKPIPKQ